jgi:TRAP-type uncharacterized transport system substrate-binding protein
MKLVSRVYDPVTGITEEHYVEGTKVHIKRWQDIEENVELNKKMFNSVSSKSKEHLRKADGLVQMASIPLSAVENLKQTRGVDILTCTEGELKRLLNSSEFAKFRTAPGVL